VHRDDGFFCAAGTKCESRCKTGSGGNTGQVHGAHTSGVSPARSTVVFRVRVSPVSRRAPLERRTLGNAPKYAENSVEQGARAGRGARALPARKGSNVDPSNGSAFWAGRMHPKRRCVGPFAPLSRASCPDPTEKRALVERAHGKFLF